MMEAVHEKVSVISVYDHLTNKTTPYRIKWHGRVYTVTEVASHNTHQDGNILYHFFSLAASNLYFRLKFNTKTLQWFVEETQDASEQTA